MKKLYTLALAASCILAASAATQKPLSVVSDAQLQQNTLQLNQKAITEQVMTSKAAAAASEAKPAKAPAKAPAATELEGEWDCTYQGLLTSNSGLNEGTATLTWDTYYEEFEIDFPGNNTGVPLYASYNAATGVLTFERQALTYANAAQTLFVAQWPMNGTTAARTVTAKYDEATGAIVFAQNVSLALAQTKSTNATTADGYYWAGTSFTLERPDGDYALKVAFDEECTDNNSFNLSVTLGSDIAKAYLLLMDGDWDASDVAKQLDANLISFLQQMGATEISYDVTIPLNLDGQVEESDFYTVMAFGYNAAGALVKKTQDCVFVVVDEDDLYQTIGEVDYNDQLVNGYYNNFTNHQTVELQEKIGEPGVYRLVDAYAGQSAIHADGHSHHIYIDAQDPEFVNINASATGLDFGDGMLFIGTMGGALGYSKEQCKAYGYTVGNLKERTITFPTRTVLAHEKGYDNPGSWSYMNPNNVMTIELPELTLNVTVLSDAVTRTPIDGATVEVSSATSNEPLAISEEEGEAENTAVTDADGKFSVKLPATIDYLEEVVVTVTDCEGVSVSQSVKLNGADNDYEFLSDELTAGITDAAINAVAPVEYFNLQGVRIDNPAEGQVVIRRQGTAAKKVVF